MALDPDDWALGRQDRDGGLVVSAITALVCLAAGAFLLFATLTLFRVLDVSPVGWLLVAN